MNIINKFEIYINCLTYLYLKADKKLNEKDLEIKLKSNKFLSEYYYSVLNKNRIIKNEIKRIFESCYQNNELDEELFFARIDDVTSKIDEADAELIYTQLINSAKELNIKIKNIKEPLLQIKNHLQLYKSYEFYESQEYKIYKKAVSPLKQFMVALPLISIIFGAVYYFAYLYENEPQEELNLFIDDKIVFNEINFNKMVVYKNKFDIENNFFLKQAVIYLYGDVEISFDPNNLNFNRKENRVTFFHPKDNLFNIAVTSKDLLIDEITTEPITEEEANLFKPAIIMATSIGGGLIANRFYSIVGKIFPTSFVSNLVTTGLGAAAGGYIGYELANNLSGIKLSQNITEKEKRIVVNNSTDLIKALFYADPTLNILYKNKFEEYIRDSYGAHGFEIEAIEYKEL